MRLKSMTFGVSCFTMFLFASMVWCQPPREDRPRDDRRPAAEPVARPTETTDERPRYERSRDTREDRAIPREGERTAMKYTQKASLVIGSTVNVSGSDHWGRVEDLILTTDGRVDYLVVSVEGRLTLVPWGAARLDSERKTVTVDVARDRLHDLPTFTQDSWPSLTDTQYVQRLNTYYNVRPGVDRRLDRRDGRRR